MTSQVPGGLVAVWSADCLRHEPAGEVWLGIWETGTEVPARASVLLRSVTEAGAAVTEARSHDPSALTAVHDAELVDHLATIWKHWQAGGYVRPAGSRLMPPCHAGSPQRARRACASLPSPQARQSQSFALNTAYSDNDVTSMSAIATATPQGLPKPAYGTFMP